MNKEELVRDEVREIMGGAGKTYSVTERTLTFTLLKNGSHWESYEQRSDIL